MSKLHQIVNPRGIIASGDPPSAEHIVKSFRKNNKLGVPEMRKYMKTMVAELFFDQKYSPYHKCRGIWQNKPIDWPSDIPFLDPNNPESKDGKKPGKNVLQKMMKFLVEAFEVSHGKGRKKDGSIIACQPSDWREHHEQQEKKIQLISSDFETIDLNEVTGQGLQEDSDLKFFFNIGNVVATEETSNVQLSQVCEEVAPLPHNAVTEEMNHPQTEETNFDIVTYCDGQGETGVEPDTYTNLNVTKHQQDSDNTQLIFNASTVATLPVPEPQPLPPVESNDMVGISVSNAGEVSTSHMSAGLLSLGGVELDQAASTDDLLADLMDPISNYLMEESLMEGIPIEGFPIEGFPIEGFPIEGFPIEGYSMEEKASGQQVEYTQDIPTSVMDYSVEEGEM